MPEKKAKTLKNTQNLKASTKQLHINKQLHKKFKTFCSNNDRRIQEVTELAIKEIMKQPELV